MRCDDFESSVACIGTGDGCHDVACHWTIAAMPIVDVELICASDAELAGISARRIADALGAVFGSPPGRTWIRLRALPASAYAETDADVNAGALPVFVTVPAPDNPPIVPLALILKMPLEPMETVLTTFKAATPPNCNVPFEIVTEPVKFGLVPESTSIEVALFWVMFVTLFPIAPVMAAAAVVVPLLVMLLPNIKLVRLLQFPNAKSPMLMTLSGIVMLVRSQASNAELPIVVTLSGIVTLLRLIQEENARSEIAVTLLGTVMLVSPRHWKNAPDPIVVTLSGIVTFVRPVHSRNAISPMLITLSGIT